MAYLKGLNFRQLQEQYVYIELNPGLAVLLQSFPEAEASNGFLGYAFIDHIEGLQLEVLCRAFYDEANHSLKLQEGAEDVSLQLPYGLLQEQQALLLPKTAIPEARFGAKVEKITAEHKAGASVLKTRNIVALDSCRHPERPDEVLVYLVQGEAQFETGYVRLEEVGELMLSGILLAEPENSCSVQQGDRISFYMAKNEQGIMCLATV